MRSPCWNIASVPAVPSLVEAPRLRSCCLHCCHPHRSQLIRQQGGHPRNRSTRSTNIGMGPQNAASMMPEVHASCNMLQKLQTAQRKILLSTSERSADALKARRLQVKGEQDRRLRSSSCAWVSIQVTPLRPHLWQRTFLHPNLRSVAHLRKHLPKPHRRSSVQSCGGEGRRGGALLD